MNDKDFKPEWSPADFKKMEKAITKFFKLKSFETSHGTKHFSATYKSIDQVIGLAYTSSSSYAMLSACNIDVYLVNNKHWRYCHFCMTNAGVPMAAVKNNEEKYQYMPL